MNTLRNGNQSISSGDPKNAYGSWGISTEIKVLTYDGRDDILLAREKNASAFNYKAIALKDLSFDIIIEYIDLVKDDTSLG